MRLYGSLAVAAILSGCGAGRDSTPQQYPDAAAATTARAATPPRRLVAIADTDITAIGYDRGRPSAPVVVVDFSDFGCPYCGEFEREAMPSIDREYISTGKVYFKYVPFVAGMFPNSIQATRAAECAADQGQFWQMHDRLYASQPEWKKHLAPFQLFLRDAAELQLDGGRFSACYVSRRSDVRTERATSVANRVGVRVTPSFVVNGHPVEGALPLAEFRKLLDDALTSASRKR